LTDLRGNGRTNPACKLIAKLKEAGTRIYAHPSQADDLACLAGVVEYTASADDAVVLSTSNLPIELPAENEDSEMDEMEESDYVESQEESMKAEEAEPQEVVKAVEVEPPTTASHKKPETPKQLAARLKKEARAAAKKAKEEAKAEAAIRRAATQAQLKFKLLDNKFIKLTDLIPPLPQKGDFEVEEIKASPYFFS